MSVPGIMVFRISFTFGLFLFQELYSSDTFPPQRQAAETNSWLDEIAKLQLSYQPASLLIFVKLPKNKIVFFGYFQLPQLDHKRDP